MRDRKSNRHGKAFGGRAPQRVRRAGLNLAAAAPGGSSLAHLSPFDVAPEARPLIGCDGFCGNQGVERRTQISPSHGHTVTRTAVIELSSIDKPASRVVKEKVRRALRVEGACD